MTSGNPPTTDFGTVVDWLEGRLDADTGKYVEELMLAGDPDVVATVAWWRRFAVATRLPTEPVPPGLAARLREMQPPAEADAATDPSWLDRFAGMVRATLSFDSLQTPGLAQTRSMSDATRQLVFSGPGLDVAVDVSELRGRKLTATVQLLPLDDDADPAGVHVQTWTSTGLVGKHRSDALGRVELGVLPADIVLMEVDRTTAWPTVHAELDLRRPA